MSTILETLKKLEEEKRLMEKELDLKELVLREDQKLQVTEKVSRKNFLIAGLALIITILVVLILFKRSPNENHKTYLPIVPLEQKPRPVERKGSEPAVGIPLSKIPERHQPDKEKVSENPLLVKKAPVQKFLQPIVDSELPKTEKIRDLIQTTATETEQPKPNSYSEELVSRGISIPNLKVKGIIFFSSDSPSNHIFVSTLESKNRKVRVGDTVQSAKLTHIETNRVVFSYQGEVVRLRIGE
jgi:hypothetical protein